MRRDVTPEEVRDLWRYLGVSCRFAVADKSESEIMQVGARVVELVTRQSAADFMSRFATTIPTPWGVMVYLPFTPGEPTQLWPLRAQFDVATHEAQHACQWHKDGIAWPVLYVSEPASRARYETEARAAANTVRWHCFGELPDPERDASGLSSYGCSVVDVAVSAEELRLDAQTIRAGGIPHFAARQALNWRDLHAPDLRP